MSLAHGRAGLRAAPARMGALRAVLYFPCAACGAVAQSGEHLLCKQGVRGSNPLSSTKTHGKHSSSVEGTLSGVRSPYGAIVRRGDSVEETALPGATATCLTNDLNERLGLGQFALREEQTPAWTTTQDGKPYHRCLMSRRWNKTTDRLTNTMDSATNTAASPQSMPLMSGSLPK